MNFQERIGKALVNFADDDNYGVFRIVNGKANLVQSGNKKSCQDTLNNLKKTEPKYVIRKLSNLWSFSAFNIDAMELTCHQVLDALRWIASNSKNHKMVLGCTKLINEFSNLCKENNLMNFSALEDVESKWTPPEGMFSEWSAEDIAKEVHKSHDTLKSGMACLNFYLNRGGDNIPEKRRSVIENAKNLLRDMY